LIFFDNSQSDRYEEIFHCGFDPTPEFCVYLPFTDFSQHDSQVKPIPSALHDDGDARKGDHDNDVNDVDGRG